MRLPSIQPLIQAPVVGFAVELNKIGSSQDTRLFGDQQWYLPAHPPELKMFCRHGTQTGRNERSMRDPMKSRLPYLESVVGAGMIDPFIIELSPADKPEGHQHGEKQAYVQISARHQGIGFLFNRPMGTRSEKIWE